MAVFFMGSEPEIFDSFGGSAETSGSGNTIISGQNRAALLFTSVGQTALGSFTAQTQGWVHFRWERGTTNTSFANTANLFELRNATDQILFRMENYAGNLFCTAYALSQPGVTVNAGTIDINFSIHATAGFIRVWNNGLNVINYEGPVQFASGAQAASKIFIRGMNSGISMSTWFSQFLVSDLSTINAKVITCPLTVTTPNDWDGTPTNVTGTSLAGLANAIKEQVPDQKIRFTVGDVPALGATEYIGGVSLHASALAEVGTAVPKLGATAFNGTTEVDIGTAQTKTAAFSPTNFLMNNNPITSSAWNATDFNNIQFALVAKA